MPRLPTSAFQRETPVGNCRATLPLSPCKKGDKTSERRRFFDTSSVLVSLFVFLLFYFYRRRTWRREFRVSRSGVLEFSSYESSTEIPWADLTMPSFSSITCFHEFFAPPSFCPFFSSLFVFPLIAALKRDLKRFDECSNSLINPASWPMLNSTPVFRLICGLGSFRPDFAPYFGLTETHGPSPLPRLWVKY